MTTPRMGTLYQEHVFLGANFEPTIDESYQRVSSYAGEKDAVAAMANGCVLSDLTGATYQLVCGPDAAAMAQAAFCGKRLAVGECAFEPALGGDGCLMSVPLVVRCGDTEHVVVDLGSRGAVAQAWLGFLATAEQDGVRPYGNTTIEDATSMLTPLMLAGDAASHVLSDYLHGQQLPRRGQVASLSLDAISAVVACAPLEPLGINAYFLFIPPAKARTLWRSFLSFEEVTPVGLLGAKKALFSAVSFGDLCEKNDKVIVTKDELAGMGLVRSDGGFIGCQALDATGR